MSWQDIVIGFGNYIFFIALLPSVFGKDKPAFISSITTGVILVAFGFTFITLHLWNSAAGSFLTGIEWLVLAAQKYSSGV